MQSNNDESFEVAETKKTVFESAARRRGRLFTHAALRSRHELITYAT
jgi:hypothetical protein